MIFKTELSILIAACLLVGCNQESDAVEVDKTHQEVSSDGDTVASDDAAPISVPLATLLAEVVPPSQPDQDWYVVKIKSVVADPLERTCIGPLSTIQMWLIDDIGPIPPGEWQIDVRSPTASVGRWEIHSFVDPNDS